MSSRETSVLNGRPPRKERLRQNHPERFAEIVRVATRVLATDGYTATNVNRVAEEAGVSVGTLYNYFDDKDDLFLTCVQAAAATDLREKQRGVDTSVPAMEMLRAIVRIDRELLGLDPEGQQLLRSVFYGINSHLSVGKLAQSFYMGSIDLVDRAVAKACDEGLFDLGPDARRLASLLINGMMETLHVLSPLLEGAGPHTTDQGLELLCRGLFSPEGRARAGL